MARPPEPPPSKIGWGKTLWAVKRAMRRGGPERVAIIAVPAEIADDLRRGVACERVWLEDLGGHELPVLTIKPPGHPPERLQGWSPPRREWHE